MIKIVIDDKVEFEGTVSKWEPKPPDLFKDMLRPNAKPEPHMMAILPVFAGAVQAGIDMTIVVVTGEKKWSMEVETP